MCLICDIRTGLKHYTYECNGVKTTEILCAKDAATLREALRTEGGRITEEKDFK